MISYGMMIGDRHVAIDELFHYEALSAHRCPTDIIAARHRRQDIARLDGEAITTPRQSLFLTDDIHQSNGRYRPCPRI